VFNIHVTDQGTGISKKDLSTIFKPKASDKSKGNGIVESNGLGLSISQKIAQSLGGDLTY
jgi:signal transduction histidine kinase